MTIDETSLVPRKAYVEDAPDADSGAIAIVDPPPPAPTPPPAVQPGDGVNVFDFLVTEETPNASRVSLGGSKEQMKMVENARSVFDAGSQLARVDEDGDMNGYDDEYEDNGYSYGAELVVIEPEDTRQEYVTPAPRRDRDGKKAKEKEREPKERKSTDKKRKRHHVEELDLSAARACSDSRDEVMEDAPPLLHTGLTGGLTRLLSNSEFPPSPDYSGGDGFEASPLSPLKRTRTTTAGEHKVRHPHRTTSALVRVARKISSSTRASDESQSRPRKHHRKHRHHEHDARLSSEKPARKLKALTYHAVEADDSQQQLVVYRTRAEHFLSFVQKGPESEHGCSVNKALKRYHRERGEQGLGLGKQDEEKELWKSLRLRKNERGEIVVFF